MPETLAIVPLYDHARTVESVLDGLADAGLETIVIDDGSTDDGAAVAAAWFARTGHPGLVERLDRNRGKAAAIEAGLAIAARRGALRALTIDADGQHDARRIPAFLAAADDAGPGPTLVLGDRRPLPRDYPLGRLAGRTLSGLAVRAACGARVGDAACGMRLYDVTETRRIRCLGGRYAWEEEAIVRLAWRGVRVRSVPIPVIYRDPGIAPSHYRFRRDWTEGVLVLVASVLLRIVDPRRGWCGEGAPHRELLWPLARGDAWTGLLAIAAAGVGAAWAAASALALDGVAALAVAALPLAVATVRTRAPILPAAAGAALGWLAPAIAIVAALPLTVAWLVVRIGGSRGRADGTLR